MLCCGGVRTGICLSCVTSECGTVQGTSVPQQCPVCGDPDGRTGAKLNSQCGAGARMGTRDT